MNSHFIKLVRRAAAGALAAALAVSLCACGGKDGTAASGAFDTGEPVSSAANPAGSTVAMGRWVEERLELDGADWFFVRPVLLEDGTLVAYGGTSRDELRKFTSRDDGATWQEQPTEWADTAQNVSPGLFAVSDLGSVFFADVTTDDAGAYSFHYYLAAAGQAPAELALTGLLEQAGADLSQPVFLDEATLAFSYSEHGADGRQTVSCLALYSFADDALTLLDAGELSDANLYGAVQARGEAAAYRIYYAADGCGLQKLCADGSVETVVEALPSTPMSSAFDMDADGNLYYLSQGGICRLAAGGSLGELVVDGSSMLLATTYASCLCRAANGDLIVSYLPDSSAQNSGLYRYHWDETLPTENAVALTLWSLYESPTLRAAAVAYGQAHPDVTVNYTPAIPEDSAVTEDDAIKTLNTELLSGAGPDILVFDGVDYAPYAEKGLLADLSAMTDRSALAESVTAPFYGDDGAAFVLPARFGIPVLFGDTGDVEALQSLEDVAAAVQSAAPRADVNMMDNTTYYSPMTEEERFALSFLSVDDVLQFAMETSAPALLTQDGAVDEDAVRRVLAFVETVARHYDMKNYRPADEQEENGVACGSGETDTVTVFDNAYEYSFTAHARYGWTTMDTTALCTGLGRPHADDPSGGERDTPYTILPRPGLVEGAYLPKTLVGVNAASTQSENAAAFVALLFGEDAQTLYHQDGMPVSRAALNAMVGRNNEDEPLYTGDVQTLLDGCKTPVIIDSRVDQVMLTHARALSDGTETLDGAVEAVKNELALYLAERR